MDFVEYMKKGDGYAIHNQIELQEICADYAIVRAPLCPDTANADGVAQGGFVYSVADLAFAFFSNHIHPRTVTQSSSITFVAPGRGPVLYAKAQELTCSRHNNTVEVRVYDDHGTVAVALFNGFISEWKQD